MTLLKTAIYQVMKSNRFLVFNRLSPLQVRTSTYKASGFVEEDPSKYTDYEVIHNPEEWKYVERLLPSKWIPDPKPKKEYHSGWKPQTAVPESFPYFIERTKNHLLPVYLHVMERGLNRRTVIRRVEGDIWKLADDLIDFLKTQGSYKTVGVKVEELKRTITLRGDYVEYTKKFFTDNGF